MNFYSNSSKNVNGADLNSLGLAAIITHEFLHPNSYYEVDNNKIKFEWGGEPTLAYGGYMEKMQGVLKDFINAKNFTGVSDFDIKAISTIGIGWKDDSGAVIQAVADVVGEYSKNVLGVTLDSGASDYRQKLAAAYSVMVDDVTKRTLIKSN